MAQSKGTRSPSLIDLIIARDPNFERWREALSQIKEEEIEDLDAADLQKYGVSDRKDRKLIYNIIQRIIVCNKQLR